jgi:2-polyprenyl-3-methyl-5-hydroxy-6-metoxy-1,4-benzoquinol methylase
LDIGCRPGTFTPGLAAKLNGSNRKVIAIDLQEKMIQKAQAKNASDGMLSRVQLHQCTSDSLNIDVCADFILSFWMIHEVTDQFTFIDQTCNLLKMVGYYFIAEPKSHVSK